MNRHERLAAGIIPVPQETMRPLGSDHRKAGPFQCRDDDAARERRQRYHASASATGTSWSIGEARSRSGRNGLAILPHHLQTQLDRLARIRLRLFQGFAVGNPPGASHRNPV
jgi:hypothetical protein